ncbi:hypothetical protein OG562_06310 [Streptomyces sp. NBC_01275]|uniref:hypothetical protein n=1 Tax=Streptomyces sp. NBC_01275 TaxID=2903807 RepID=UPI0022546C7F|nr:hypothetical protein [Streptomyces sp. NBC_01275]MCX4760585.1 hypothetical protein [Streptomyces sp. NBC_01275]
MDIAALPFVDEHATVVTAQADAVWDAVGDALDGSFTPGYARLVGCADRAASGPRPLAVGSTVPGFRVASAAPGRELVLVGRHRFSTYALVFRLDEAGPGRVRLCAETRARFPGPAGGLYRLLVVASGAHAVLTGRLLAGIRRRAEQVRSGTPRRTA